jgi:hypothetical protein
MIIKGYIIIFLPIKLTRLYRQTLTYTYTHPHAHTLAFEALFKSLKADTKPGLSTAYIEKETGTNITTSTNKSTDNTEYGNITASTANTAHNTNTTNTD